LATDKCLVLQRELLALRSEYQRTVGNLNIATRSAVSGGTLSGNGGTGGLTKTGTGTPVLSGTNSQSGGTAVSGGALRDSTASDAKRLEARVASLRELMAAREKEYGQAYDAAIAEGRRSVSAEMAADEVRTIEEILHRVEVERERLRVELNAPARVKVLAPAAVPE
jgi:autotransporter-associated beta strand protein